MCQTRPNLADVINVNRSTYLGTFHAMTTNRFHDNLHKQTKDSCRNEDFLGNINSFDSKIAVLN